MPPRLLVDLAKLRRNAQVVAGLIHSHGLDFLAVAKGCSALPEVARIMLEAGAQGLGDSRLLNIRRLREAGLQTRMTLLRAPALSEAAEAVALTDASLNSEPAIIEALARETREQGRAHDVVLMVDLGDLREGVLAPDLPALARKVEELSTPGGLRLAGVGANFNCISGLMPTREKFAELAELARGLEALLGRPLEIVSAGNSAALDLLAGEGPPPGLTQIRAGAAMLLGFDDIRDRDIPGMARDVFVLEAEVLELLEKPSKPWGELGLNVFGERPEFADGGRRLRAILDVGRQDVHPDYLVPLESGVLIKGASSDHLVLDVDNLARRLQVGDVVRFGLAYPAILSLTTSPYVQRSFSPMPGGEN